MAVNLSSPLARELLAVNGVRLGVTQAGIRKQGRTDVLLIELAAGSRVGGRFTRNRFSAAPVLVAKEHLATGEEVRALVVNTGNANAGTGEQGLMDARKSCHEVARRLAIKPTQVLPFSTGVIMERLPVDRLIAGLPACVSDLRDDNWLPAAQAIMTTDTVPKAASRRLMLSGRETRITGIAKGSGMIHPDMATMLAFVATDASLSQPVLESLLSVATEQSFNAITVDGDTSTNDAFMLIATGGSGATQISDPASPAALIVREAVVEIANQLAQAIIRDGEGATKFIAIVVDGGRSVAECRQVAYAIAHSPLVKTAFFASDPNLGRILAAIGYAGIDDLDVQLIDLSLGDVLVLRQGGRDRNYKEEDGKQIMQQSEISVRVALNRGAHTATVWTCDLSHDYVTINAEYRT